MKFEVNRVTDVQMLTRTYGFVRLTNDPAQSKHNVAVRYRNRFCTGANNKYVKHGVQCVQYENTLAFYQKRDAQTNPKTPVNTDSANRRRQAPKTECLIITILYKYCN